MAFVEVLKFGSSVLRSGADIPIAVDEIYRRCREGRLVLAVVSAFEGITDQLLEEASALFRSTDEAAIAAHVCEGERRTAEALVAALNESGVPASALMPEQIQLVAEGTYLESVPSSVQLDTLRKLWNDFPVVVLPGFYGINRIERVALFGRGGSDMSAIFLASELGASCRLLKDVDGVFAADPAVSPAAHRFTQMSWVSAIDVAGPLIQPKALRFAQIRSLPFEVGRPNEAAHTSVGHGHDAWIPPLSPPRPLRIALVGCGIVGRGVYERVRQYPSQFEIVHVVVKDTTKHPDVKNLTTDVAATMDPSIEIVLVCIGGTTLANPLIVATASVGKYVITSNKAVIAAYGQTLSDYACGPARRLWYSAAVGGSLPAIETLAQLKSPPVEVRAVINGTCGAILQSLASGETWADAVAAAQAAGFAEANPARDLSGRDSADKLTILCAAAFGTWIPPDMISTVGIDALQGDYGRYQLVARARRTESGIKASVTPEILPADSFLGQSRGAENRLEIELSTGGVIRLRGHGAGRWPTAVSVLGDLHEVARVIHAKP